MKFVIKIDGIETKLEKTVYDEYAEYNTSIYDDNDKLVFSGLISGSKYRDIVPKSLLSYAGDWEDAIVDYIESYNKKINSIDVKFDILDVDDRHAYKFKEYIGKKEIKSGTGFCKDLKTQREKTRWRAAVIDFKTKRGISMASTEIKKLIKELYDAIDKIDNALPEIEAGDLKLPLIEFAIPELGTNPCEFLEDMKHAANVAIARINGIPSHMEIGTYMVKKVSANVINEVRNKICSVKALLKTLTDPVIKVITLEDVGQKTGSYRDEDFDFTAFFAQIDAEAEEFAKEHPQEFAAFKSVIKEQKDFDWASFYDSVQEAANRSSSGDVGTAGANVSYDVQYDSTAITFNEVASTGRGPRSGHGMTNVYNTAPSQEHANNIQEALRNCFIPLKLAWGEYCKENKLGSGGWNINSGYRAPDYNKAIGGVQNSAHAVGYAIDIGPLNGKTKLLGEFIYNYCCNAKNNIRFDQCLAEKASTSPGEGWIHLGYKTRSGSQRGMYAPDYNADKNASGGNVKYLPKHG